MIAQVLDQFGVVVRWRAAMRLELGELREQPHLPPGYTILPWQPERLDEVARVDFRAYQGTIDGLLYQSYFGTVDGCARMWRECITGRFGRFDAQRSLLLIRDGRVCGDIMVAQTGPGDAFIGNLAVDPAHRGGTGRGLLLTCLWGLKAAGYQGVGLAVTLDNRRAFRLYESLGFRVASRFPKVTRVGPARAAAVGRSVR